MSEQIKSVLVVDDEPIVRMLVKRILERNGMAVIEAVDGLDALKLLETFRPDLILSDIKMPRIDGISLLAMVAEKMPDVPVVMMSGYSSEAATLRDKKTGCPFIAKPFAPNALADVVKRHMSTGTCR